MNDNLGDTEPESNKTKLTKYLRGILETRMNRDGKRRDSKI